LTLRNPLQGKGQPWVSQTLLFGRFLNFITTVINAELAPKNLTERKFRSYWEQTDKSPNERSRFMQALVLISPARTLVMCPRHPPG
jgi:hypothetical protein